MTRFWLSSLSDVRSSDACTRNRWLGIAIRTPSAPRGPAEVRTTLGATIGIIGGGGESGGGGAEGATIEMVEQRVLRISLYNG